MMLEDGYGTSTLGDFNTALTVLLLTKLSMERVYYGDLQHIDKKKKAHCLPRLNHCKHAL